VSTGTVPSDRTAAAPPSEPARPPAWAAALVGVLAGAVTIGVAELVGALLVTSGHAGGTPSPVSALGSAFIDRTPPWLKNFAVSTFGTHDKTALLAGIAVVVVVLAALAGVLAVRRRVVGLLVVVLLAAVAVAAVVSRPHATPLDALPTVVGALVGLVSLRALVDRLELTRTATGPYSVGVGRRSLLQASLGLGVLGFVSGIGSQLVGRGAARARASRADVLLPQPVGAGPTTAELAGADVPGLSALVTPAADFYRIDTAFAVPQVAASAWRLRVHGMVDHEIDISFADLLALPMVERLTTLSCVSNEVGGDLIGTQVWLGHPIRELLARAVPQAGADMVLSTSADGWTAGTPLDALTDPGRDALLAVGMGGQPLPVEHGFPVRMVVPGLYGYVSATKWVVDLEVTRFDKAEGYWTPRGWSDHGPIKTESRIDVPRSGAPLQAGQVVVAGVAWAPHRGVSRVQVRVDDGDWADARLESGGTADTWRQWVWTWAATKGDHRLQVRATDGTGQTQTGDQAAPAPDGATGWHSVDLSVA
jgi:DMSO/TMAO reductase YedYZ molybdopterin-dependent catalytic subunit